MKLRTKAVWSLAIAFCSALICAARLAAQTVTTGNIAGTMTDAQGGVLPGATVVAVHTDTGTSYEAVTGSDGRYNILNVRVGAYTIGGEHERVQRRQKQDDSGRARRRADRRLQAAARDRQPRRSTSSASSPLIDISRAPARPTTSPNEVKENLPTILAQPHRHRPHQPDVQRAGRRRGDSASVVSVAGNSPRYNSLQIDGAANNDLFGLASSAGAPGGTAETQPISLDAIQEIQLVVSPYDVRQGGFTGGGINAVTKSGTNSIRGTRVLLRPQPGLGRQGRHRRQDLDPQGQAGRRQRRRPDREEPRVLLRHRRLRPQGTPDRLLGEPGRPDDRQRGAGRRSS